MNLNELLESLDADSAIVKSAETVEQGSPLVTDDLAGILEKKASEDLTASAFAQGEALAKQLLEKLANEIQIGNEIMQAQDDKKVVPVEAGGTVEDTLKGTVEQAVERGATSDDRVDDEVDTGAAKPAGESVAPGEVITGEIMDKQAQENKSLAAYIMEKLAQDFSAEVTTPAAATNVEGAPVPNKIQQDNAAMTAQDDAKVQGVVPGSDGTVNALFKTIVEKAIASGAGSDNLVSNNPSDLSTVESVSNGDEIVEGAKEEVEKAAAVSALCDAGMDFDTAVSLVKQAEQELKSDAWELEKKAAFNSLCEAGVSFDTAIALIKQAEDELSKKASVAGVAKGLANAIKTDAGALKGQLSNVAAAAKANGTFTKGTASTIKAVAKNKAVQAGAAGATAVGAGAAALRGNEKKACVELLMAEGIDFDTAVELTKQAELEVYGK